MKILSWDIRHGGSARIPRIQQIIAGHHPRMLVLPEFLNNPSGATLRRWLTKREDPHQSAGAADLPGKYSPA
jgi:hypothetical protein